MSAKKGDWYWQVEMYLVTVKYTHVHKKTKKIKKAIVDSKTQEIGLQSSLCKWVILLYVYIFFFWSSDIDKPQGYLIKMSCETS